jgi:hypothetical protein
MVDKQEGQWVVPNPQVPRTFGMMNIVFGGLLLLMGAGYVAAWVLLPYYTKPLLDQAARQQTDRKAKRDAQIADLKRQEDAAKTEEDKESFQVQRENLERNAEPDMSEFMDLSNWNVFSDIRLAIYYCTELGVGMLLNLLMVISGVGLLGLAEWARRLAVGVAWAKILRWVAMTIMTMVLVLPITTQKMQKAFDQLEQQTKVRGGRAGPFPMGSMAQFTAISGAVTAVFEALVFSIYPGLTIWFLTRPRVRAACMAKLPLRPPVPGDELGEIA